MSSELKIVSRHAGTILVGQLAVMAFGVADTVIAGRHSDSALAALSVGSALYISVYVALMGMGSAGPGLGAPMHEFISRDTHGVFTLMFGSWHGDWDHPDTVLKAPLMTTHGLVSVWSGRPHWFFHPMGLGETVGYVTRLTQNNTGLRRRATNRRIGFTSR